MLLKHALAERHLFSFSVFNHGQLVPIRSRNAAKSATKHCYVAIYVRRNAMKAIAASAYRLSKFFADAERPFRTVYAIKAPTSNHQCASEIAESRSIANDMSAVTSAVRARRQQWKDFLRKKRGPDHWAPPIRTSMKDSNPNISALEHAESF
jgi:hypothetical protein